MEYISHTFKRIGETHTCSSPQNNVAELVDSVMW